mmetsp:Transcript_24600/g.62913  ORF Transcript_24600/g.62913 Transcript_24600/m.62913 type:complete len:93 (-) Transcript_24600:91-369(-)
MRSYGGVHASPHRVGGVMSMLRAPSILMWWLLNGIEEGSWSGLLTRGDIAQNVLLGEAMFMVVPAAPPLHPSTIKRTHLVVVNLGLCEYSPT